jgi:hypothetical protein
MGRGGGACIVASCSVSEEGRADGTVAGDAGCAPHPRVQVPIRLAEADGRLMPRPGSFRGSRRPVVLVHGWPTEPEWSAGEGGWGVANATALALRPSGTLPHRPPHRRAPSYHRGTPLPHGQLKKPFIGSSAEGTW